MEFPKERAQRYRQRAEDIRAEAEASPTLFGERLLEIARQYDELAELMEKLGSL